MNRLPLRARLTLVVAVASAVALSLLAALATSSIDVEITNNVVQSTSAALTDLDRAVIGRSDDLLVAWQDRVAESSTSDENEDGDGFALAGLAEEVFGDDIEGASVVDVVVLDIDGRPWQPDSFVDGSVRLAVRNSCVRWGATSSDCTSEQFGPADVDVVATLLAAVEDRPSSAPGVTVGSLFLWGETPVLVVVEAGVDDETLSSGLGEFAPLAIIVLVGLLALVTWLSVGRAIRPVEAIATEVERIGNDNLENRVPVPPARDQLRNLATTMNTMLDRLQGSRDRQRRFISDASHELRSPVAATLATLEVARANPSDTDWTNVAAVVQEENLRLAELIDDLLLLARLDESDDVPAVHVDLDEVSLAEAARPHPVPVTVRVLAPARVVAGPSMLVRAIRNLVDNAVAHAASAVEVEIDADVDRNEAIVRVIDDGPGIAPAHRETIFERFTRVDESRARAGDQRGGAGLGLAIVAEVAAASGGVVMVDPDHPDDGACFVLTLPLADPSMSTLDD